MKLAARFLTAMAIVSLAIMYIATRDQLPDASAATGKINALNVGTCYATDEKMFTNEDCVDGSDAAYDVTGRKAISKETPLYATYAYDPKTSGRDPRAIVFNGDLLKISIKDDGRDKRTGVLFPVTEADRPNQDFGMRAGAIGTAEYMQVIRTSVGDDFQEGETSLSVTSPDAGFVITAGTGLDKGTHVSNSGIKTLNWLVETRASVPVTPIAPIHDNDGHGMKTGKVRLFGFIQENDGTLELNPADADDFRDLSSRVTLDEDYGCIPDPKRPDPDGACRGDAPWFDARFDVDEGMVITVMYVYYETSEQEEIVGGRKKSDYVGHDANEDGDFEDTEDAVGDIAPTIENAVPPAFVGDEDPATASNQKAIVASVSADGDETTRNLWLKETGLFTGTYVGYVRLTDPNGNGTEAGKRRNAGDTAFAPPDNWGRQVRDAVAPDTTEGAVTLPHLLPTADEAAVIGVDLGDVVIKYRDTDEDEQSLAIKIDVTRPTVTIDAPVNKESTRDASPNMSGEFGDDGGSGLRENSFKLFADNKDDEAENGDKGTPVFDLKVDENQSSLLNRRGYVAVPTTTTTQGGMTTTSTETATVDNSDEYTGYKDALGAKDSPFGIVLASEVYHAESGDDSEYTVKVSGTSTSFDKYKVVDAEDFDDGADSGEFGSSVRFDFAETLPNETFNNTIDYQAVVMDRAGNLGFSDSDTSAPRFIHEYGVRRADREADKHNVLGWYSRHILFLDLVDPEVREDESATGFFGRKDDKNIRSNNGVMVVFDKPVSEEGITTSTFEVTLGDGGDATVTEVDVEGKRVFLLLEEELAPDAKPKVDLASGELIRDLAGNTTLPREFEEIDVSDGILPTFTLSLSNGSGRLPPDYGPNNLTKDRITVTITSNETIQGAPRVAVLCSGFNWVNSETLATMSRDAQLAANNVSKYIENRTGSMTSGAFTNAEPTDAMIGKTAIPPEEGGTADGNCYETDAGEDNENPDEITKNTALRRGDNRWEHRWTNLDELQDGKLIVVVSGRDRGGFKEGSNNLVNYSAEMVEFRLDTELIAPTKPGGGRVIPRPGTAVSEPRPFVMIDFDEVPPVNITKFELDNEDVLARLEQLDDNRFVYWPTPEEPLEVGNYTVNVEANDAANNTTEFKYKFSVRERLPFSLNLLAGWNTISFPSNPQDRALHAVFTEPEIDQVIGWDATNPDSPWRASTRVDGVWTTGDDYAVLNDVEARYGYWVHSQGFVTQTVKLVGKGDRIGPLFNTTTEIPTEPRGWSFIGVVDVDGDQTEDNAGQTLLNSKDAPVSAEQYLGDYRNAYTWNNIDNKWQRLRPDGPITIGTGIWVYYDKGGDIAP